MSALAALFAPVAVQGGEIAAMDELSAVLTYEAALKMELKKRQ